MLSIGYADGLPRSLSNKLEVKLHGIPCPILGRICMDMCMADVTAVPQTKVGDAAVVYDGDLNRIAELAGTITEGIVRPGPAPGAPGVPGERGRGGG